MTIANGTQPGHKWTLSLWQRAALFSVAFFICAQAGSYVSARERPYLSFWMPAGLSLAVLLLNPTRYWPWLLLAVLPANVLFDIIYGTKTPVIFCFYFANILGPLTGAWLVRRFVGECPRMRTLKEFIGLMFFGALLSSVLSGVIGAAALSYFGLARSFIVTGKILWGSNAMAILVLTPFILTWVPPPDELRDVFKSPKKIVEAVLLFLGLGACLWYSLALDKGVVSPGRLVIIPFLLWAGLRFSAYGATAACLLMALSLSFFTTQSISGPPNPPLSGYVFILQTILAMSVLISLIPAIVLSERDRTTAKLRESEARYRHLTEAAFEGISISENGILLDVNEQWLKMFGYERSEMIGRNTVDLVAPESRSIAIDCIRLGREETHELRLLHKDGSIFIAEVRARMVRVGNRTLRMTALRDVTAQKKVEQALRESEEKFSKAFRTSPDVMSITDLETGRYIEVNDAHKKTFGYDRSETVGRSPLEIGLFENPKAREEMVQELKRNGRLTDHEIQVRTRDGRVLTLLHSAELIELGGRMCVLRVSHDVTDRKRAEEALRESERRFRSYFELASVGFAITSRERRLLAVNDEYCRIMGYSREELLQKTWAELTYPEDLSVNQDLFAEVLAGKTDAYTLSKRMVRKDGRIIYGTISVRCVRRPDGAPDYFVGLLLDITEREEAIAREQQARAEYTLQLIASQEAERERIAGELHDSLGQSLSIVKNHAQLALLARDLPAATRKEMQTINDTTAEAIAEMRRISRDLHPYQLDHLGLTGALKALVDSAANASGIAFDSKLDMVDDVFPRDATTSVYRIVQEGLNNLLKHSGARNARIVMERDVREVQLKIEDDGCGFNPDGAGKGMGLKNVAERTRILGGRLKLDSAPGKGTCIEITIPISPGLE